MFVMVFVVETIRIFCDGSAGFFSAGREVLANC